VGQARRPTAEEEEVKKKPRPVWRRRPGRKRINVKDQPQNTSSKPGSASSLTPPSSSEQSRREQATGKDSNSKTSYRQVRPHQSFTGFLSCVENRAGQEKFDVMSRGPGASELWMMGGLPTFREFKINTGIEALKEVWDRLPELKTKGRDGIQKILADHWKGKFSEDNSAIIANGIWSCILLHSDKSEQSLPGTDQRDRPAAPAANHKAKTGKQPQESTRTSKKKAGRKPNEKIGDRNKEIVALTASGKRTPEIAKHLDARRYSVPDSWTVEETGVDGYVVGSFEKAYRIPHLRKKLNDLIYEAKSSRARPVG